MNGMLVLNAWSADFQKQGRMLKGFLSERTRGLKITGAVLFCGERPDRAELLRRVPAPAAVLISLPDPPSAETVVRELAAVWRENPAEVLLFPGNHFGTEAAARLGRRCGGAALLSAESLDCESDPATAAKEVYGGHMKAEFELRKTPRCLSVSRSCPEEETENGRPAELLAVRAARENGENDFLTDLEWTAETGGKSLENAPFLLVAGRGAGGREGIALLESAARKFGAELGVSRPVAMSAWVPMNRLIGVSGAMAKPDLCLAVGVSGAPALYAGIEKSKYIVSINSDPHAPIHRKADVAVVDDWRRVLPGLCEKFVKRSL